MKEKIIKSAIKSSKSLWVSLPAIFGTILLIGLLLTIVPKSFYTSIFSKNNWLDMLIGGIAGSVSVGTPITSYIIGGELLSQNISLLAVTVFIVTWVTVGIIQLPAELMIFGKKFAIYRNLTSFFLAMVVALVTIMIVNLF